MTRARPTFIQPGAIFAILAATIPGVLQACWGVSTLRAIVVVVCTIAAMGFAIPGLAWAEKREGDMPLHAVLAGYFVFTTVALFVSRGFGFLMAMPVVSVLVLYLPLARAAVFATAMLVFALAAIDQPEARVHSTLGIGSAFAFVVIFSLIARRERFARLEIERLSAELETLAATRERNRIAREIHDSVGHYLTVANVQLEAARATDVGREARIERVQGLLRDGLTELRRSVSMLRDTLPSSQPFTQALEELVNGSSATLQISGEKRLLSGAVGFTLYRAAQEGLTNAQRHAEAKRIEVRLEFRADAVRLEVRDDGRGSNGSAGNGLAGVRERVELLGGTVTHGAGPNGGFVLSIEVPT